MGTAQKAGSHCFLRVFPFIDYLGPFIDYLPQQTRLYFKFG